MSPASRQASGGYENTGLSDLYIFPHPAYRFQRPRVLTLLSRRLVTYRTSFPSSPSEFTHLNHRSHLSLSHCHLFVYTRVTSSCPVHAGFTIPYTREPMNILRCSYLTRRLRRPRANLAQFPCMSILSRLSRRLSGTVSILPVS